MPPPLEVEAQVARIGSRAKWFLIPAWVALVAVMLVGLATGSVLSGVAFVLLILLTIGWNLSFVIWRWRLRQTITVPGPTALERDDRTGHMRAAAPHGSFSQRIRSVFTAVPFDASADASANEVHWRLFEAAKVEGAGFSWYAQGEGVVIDVAVKPRDVRGTGAVHMRGTLSGGGQARLHGTISPDGAIRVFGAGVPLVLATLGLAVLLGGLGHVLFGHDHEGDWYAAVWGTGVLLAGAATVWNQSKAFAVQLRILRRAFGDGVRFIGAKP
jgi:hypothetical protein